MMKVSVKGSVVSALQRPTFQKSHFSPHHFWLLLGDHEPDVIPSTHTYHLNHGRFPLLSDRYCYSEGNTDIRGVRF